MNRYMCDAPNNYVNKFCKIHRFFKSKRGESGERGKTRKSKTPDPFSDTEVSPERGIRRPNPQIKVTQVSHCF